MVKDILICLDRDGTLIYDKRYYLGHTNDWKKKMKILKNVVNGIKLLNKKLPKARIWMTTNNPGVAIKDFPLLTYERNNEVNREVLYRLDKKGAHAEDYVFCPYASPTYVKKHPQYKFKKEFVRNSNLIKPASGMIFEAMRRAGLKKANTKVYVIGDRESDVKSALNADGFGILIPFVNHPDELAKTRKIRSKNYYVAKDFLDAAKFIVKKEKR